MSLCRLYTLLGAALTSRTLFQDSRMAIQRGIDKLADAVGVTLGPRGAWAFSTLEQAAKANVQAA